MANNLGRELKMLIPGFNFNVAFSTANTGLSVYLFKSILAVSYLPVTC